MALCIPNAAAATIVHAHEDDMPYIFHEVFGYGVPYSHSALVVDGYPCCVFAAASQTTRVLLQTPMVIVHKVLDDGTIKLLSPAVAGRLLAGICTRTV